jgi:CRP/FNR family cyclic AMP-dependent transcriptional regulator
MEPSRLKKLPIFASLTDQALFATAVFSTEVSASAGERLVQQGEYAYELSFVESGTADVLRDGEVVGRVGPGDVVGEMGLLERRLRIADVVATSPMRLVTLSSWDVKRLPAEVIAQLRETIESRRIENERVGIAA